MERKPRSKVVETEDKRTVVFDEETQAGLWAIMYKIREITQKPLTAEQSEQFAFCLLDKFFCHTDDIAEIEDLLLETAELLTVFMEKLKTDEAVR